MILGGDVGGTFTDLVAVDEGRITTAKVPTTADQSVGIATGASRLGDGSAFAAFLHGTTVATNALLERKGARVVLVTDEGFEDVIEIGRQDRPSLYDSFDDRPEPLVARSDRVTESSLTVDRLEGVDAVAIALINGHRDADSEVRVEEAVRAAGFTGPVGRSSVVAPEFREFERTSTTVLNSYLTPRTAHYLDRLGAAMQDSGLARHISVMQSSGGLASVAHAATHPASILLSGPAGGVIATAEFAAVHGHGDVVSFDMGGTSTDVCRISDGRFDVSYERSVDGYPCRLPSVGIHTVGAGGGSIAWIDPGGSLRVGPHSAGADPGPACYGRGGTRPTVTDAHAVLGRLDPSAPLGGELAIDVEAARAAVGQLADRLGMTTVGAALGIVAIADEAMGRAIRKVTIEQGSDPRGSFLYAFGGAGGLHATTLARSLGMAGVVLPAYGGVLSAVGLLLARPSADATISTMGTETSSSSLEESAAIVERRARRILEEAGHVPTNTEYVVDVRYAGQAHEIPVDYDPGDTIGTISEQFHIRHESRNGYNRPDEPIEIVTLRARASAQANLRVEDLGRSSTQVSSVSTTRPVFFSEEPETATVIHRDSLTVEATLDGPAIIEEDQATTVLAPGDRATVLASGALEITW